MENKCQFCGRTSENMYYGFIAGCLPNKQLESKIDKWGRSNWWENMERDDLTEEQHKELDEIGFYDQVLHSVGRGYECEECMIKEDELNQLYYPVEIKN